MIKQLNEKPESYFSHLREDCVYLGLKKRGEPYHAFVGLEVIGTTMGCHIHVNRWSHSILKEMFLDWELIKGFAFNQGVRVLVASNQDAASVWPRFIGRFGFKNVRTVQMSEQEL